ncbi:MAG TPA: hypothetical protein VMJ64_14570 [Anaerolineales bacterium]|nr:hypothetical protein [Anaerolineales bacterium]
MTKRVLAIASLIAAAGLFLTFRPALAHTTVHVGDYDVEVGWVDEPPVVGQRNDIVVNVSNTKSADSEVDVSKLTVDVTYGGQTKTLTLQPLSEDSMNQYIAPILPMVAGQYTVQLRGQLDTTDISQDIQPEEVVTSDTLAFPAATPAAQQSDSLGWSAWLSIISLVFALAALALGFLALRRS